MNITLVQHKCASCGNLIIDLSDAHFSETCTNCKQVRAQRKNNTIRSLAGAEFVRRKAELEALHGVTFGKRRWEKLDPDCYVPLYY